MTDTGQPANRATTGRSPSPGRVGAVGAAIALVAVVLWGGYGNHWSWTGINGHSATLWDWLHLLMLPIAVGILPLWLSRRTRLKRRHKLLSLAAIGAFAIVVLAGYVIPWIWTGFQGNTLWDWLELLALPVAVALTPFYRELRSTWDRRQTVIALLGLAGFGAVVIAGYAVPWGWTGFTGNTLWDWLHLLLLPLLIPTIIVPAVMPMASRGVVPVEDPEPVEPVVPAPETGAEGPLESPQAPQAVAISPGNPRLGDDGGA